MKYKKKWISIGILFILAWSIHIFSSDAGRVEQYYTNGIYLNIAAVLRTFFGWLPFSFGDILYAVFFIWLLIKIVTAIKALFQRKFNLPQLLPVFQSALVWVLSVYIIFNVLWGINYNRKGIGSQLGIKNEKYSLAELKMIDSILLLKVNESKALLLNNKEMPGTKKEIFHQSVNAYREVNKLYSFLNYQPVSIKTSMWGWLGNYVGFLGYYNPFTGEGQVNTTVPKFLLPYINCHEIAHQLGYAKENEANFVGYLAASASTDEIFHYSVYLDLFIYANRNLYFADSAAARSYAEQLLPAVTKDLKEWRQFNQRHVNPVEPVIRWMYGKFLENNQQPSGLLSYDEVTGLLIAYYKKYGKL